MCQVKKNKTPQKGVCFFAWKSFCIRCLENVLQKHFTLKSIWDALSDVHSLLIPILNLIQCGENPHPTN